MWRPFDTERASTRKYLLRAHIVIVIKITMRRRLDGYNDDDYHFFQTRRYLLRAHIIIVIKKITMMMMSRVRMKKPVPAKVSIDELWRPKMNKIALAIKWTIVQ